MGNLGLPELIIILVIILVIFGAGKLPQIGEALGKSIRSFKKAASGEDEEKKEDNKPENPQK
ncbi:MAG: twin-arginine translocase TatA/TatE family subunit [Deltaproteobacteria bacterium]|nr:twin-arginine translocase TatA/TatE family subunit [Deltaproteobacteria bacterium]